jgi:hypothetical protein
MRHLTRDAVAHLELSELGRVVCRTARVYGLRVADIAHTSIVSIPSAALVLAIESFASFTAYRKH